MFTRHPTRPFALAPLLVLAAAGALLGTAAQAQGTDRQARVWAATCATCHGTEGRTEGTALPPLAGRSSDELYRAMIEFKTGQRPAATVMHQHSKGYSDDELRRISAYFSVQSAKPATR